MRTRLKRNIKLPLERQQEIDADENKDKNLHFTTMAEWHEIVYLEQSDFDRKQAFKRMDGLKGSLKLSKHAKIRMTQRGITLWDMANDSGVTTIKQFIENYYNYMIHSLRSLPMNHTVSFPISCYHIFFFVDDVTQNMIC